MSIKKLMVSGLLAAFITSPLVVSTASAADDHIYMAGLAYRTGPYAPNGVPFGNGFADYLTLLNERDGGVGGGVCPRTSPPLGSLGPQETRRHQGIHLRVRAGVQR